MNALQAHSQSVTAGAFRTGHAKRICLRATPVAVPCKAASARPLIRTAKATLSASPLTTDAADASAKIVHVVTAERYHDFLAENAEKLVMMDFYAVWCGPCKVIAPEIERMAAESDPSKMVFAKFDCGATNDSKRLAMSLGIKALPTFHLYRGGQRVDTMTGAKLKALQDFIAKHL